MRILLRSEQTRFYGSFLFEVNYGGDAKQILLLLITSAVSRFMLAGGFAAGCS